VVSRVDAQIYVHSRSKGVAHDTLMLALKPLRCGTTGKT
jgi:hypothetical protein